MDLEHAFDLVEEHVVVDKRRVESGVVRVATRVVRTEEQVQVPLDVETVEIERVPVERVVEHASGPRTEGDVTIWPIYEERVVITRELVLKEEVRITRRRRTELSPVETVVLRHEVLEITRDVSTPPSAAAAPPITPKEP